MKLITYYTSSHKILLNNFFIPSIKNIDDFELIPSEGQQISVNGNYFSKGFNETTKNKIEFLLSVLSESEKEEVVLFSDVDVIFLNPIKEYLKKYFEFDITFQQAHYGLNTGFFLIKNTNTNIELLEEVIEKCHLYPNDQDSLNDIIKTKKINYTTFDDRVLSPATIIGPKILNGENLIIPNESLVFHACWCAGVDNKIKLLEYVRGY
jgi:hypothetical protein